MAVSYTHLDVYKRQLQRRTFRVLFFNIRKKIFCVFPVRLISIERKYLLPVRTVFHSLFFAFAKGLHPGQAVIRLLVQVFIIFLVLSAQTQPPPLCLYFLLKLGRLLSAYTGRNTRRIHFLRSYV